MFEWVLNVLLDSASRFLGYKVRKLALHLVSLFDCNTRVIVDGSSIPLISRVKSLLENLKLNDHVSMN